MPLTLVTAPVLEPITLDEAKHQVCQDGTIDDSHLGSILIPAVRQRGENATNRAFITQTWDYVLDAFPSDDYIELPLPPLQSVTSLKYYDTSGTQQTWASTNYDVQAPAGDRCARGRLKLSYGVTWPSTYGEIGDVTIRFVCGYGSTRESVPHLLRAAMLMDLASLDAQRENVLVGTIVTTVPGGVHDIYWSFKSHGRQRVA